MLGGLASWWAKVPPHWLNYVAIAGFSYALGWGVGAVAGAEGMPIWCRLLG